MTCVIVVTKRRDDFHAAVAGRPELWGCGNSHRAAIGDLVTAHGEHFNIEKVEFPFKSELQWVCNLRNYQGKCDCCKDGECNAEENWRNGCRYVSCCVR
jgi:hypothetical protein